jgi:hypothetical protein
VRDGRGMNREATSVSGIGDAIKQFQRINKGETRVLDSGELEVDETAQSAVEITCGALAMDASLS